MKKLASFAAINVNDIEKVIDKLRLFGFKKTIEPQAMFDRGDGVKISDAGKIRILCGYGVLMSNSPNIIQGTLVA